MIAQRSVKKKFVLALRIGEATDVCVNEPEVSHGLCRAPLILDGVGGRSRSLEIFGGVSISPTRIGEQTQRIVRRE